MRHVVKSLILSLLLAPLARAEFTFEWMDKDRRDLERMQGEVKHKGDWFKIDIDGFAVRSQVSEAFTAELAFYLQKLDAMYAALFPARPTVGNICEVVVHPDADGYHNAVRAMQVMTGGDSQRAEFIWSFDNVDKRIQSYGLHLHAKEGETLADIPRDELNGAFLRCFNQRLVGWNPIAPWFAIGVTSWMGEFEAEKTIDENRAAHPPPWQPQAPDPAAKAPRKSMILKPLIEAKHDEIAGGTTKVDQCGSFLEFLTSDKAANKTLKRVVDDMSKSRPVKFEDKEILKLEQAWLEHAAVAR